VPCGVWAAARQSDSWSAALSNDVADGRVGSVYPGEEQQRPGPHDATEGSGVVRECKEMGAGHRGECK